MFASIVLPINATYVKYTYFPTLNEYVLPFIVGLLCLLPYPLFSRLRTRNTRKVDELVGLTSLSPSVRKYPLLVLRALDDEASLALAAAAIGNRLSRLLERSSYIILHLLGYLTISIVVVILVLIAINFFWPLDDFKAPVFMTRYFQPIFVCNKRISLYQFYSNAGDIRAILLRFGWRND